MKRMFTPNHWHQTVICYKATRVRYPNKWVSYYNSQTEENEFYDSIIIAILRYGIKRKMAIILRCKLATHDVKKLSSVNLLQIFLAIFMPPIFIW